jgi:hypothetical protein
MMQKTRIRTHPPDTPPAPGALGILHRMRIREAYRSLLLYLFLALLSVQYYLCKLQK